MSALTGLSSLFGGGGGGNTSASSAVGGSISLGDRSGGFDAARTLAVLVRSPAAWIGLAVVGLAVVVILKRR